MVIRRIVLRLVGFPDELSAAEERMPKLTVYYMYLEIRYLCYFRQKHLRFGTSIAVT
jgi:hypothetical protein